MSKTQLTVKSVRLTVGMWRAIDRYRHEKKILTDSEAVRRLLVEALEAEAARRGQAGRAGAGR